MEIFLSSFRKGVLAYVLEELLDLVLKFLIYYSKKPITLYLISEDLAIIY